MFEITLNTVAAALVNDRAQVKIFPKHRRDGSQLGIRPTKFVHKEGQFKDATVKLEDAGDGQKLLRVPEAALEALGLTLTDGASYQLIDISSRCYRFAPATEIPDGAPAATVKVTDYVAPVEETPAVVEAATEEKPKAARKPRASKKDKVVEVTAATAEEDKANDMVDPASLLTETATEQEPAGEAETATADEEAPALVEGEGVAE